MKNGRDIAQEARELLAIEHEKIGFHWQAADIRNGAGKPTLWALALDAIEAGIVGEQARCARIAESHASLPPNCDQVGRDIAAAIRANAASEAYP